MTTFYTENHEWITVDGTNATVGITNHAQEQLGDLVYVELPENGKAVEKQEEFIVVESVKAASDVYAPVSGTITQGNQDVVDDPELINKSAQTEGWMIKMTISDESELTGLMDEAAYKAMIG